MKAEYDKTAKGLYIYLTDIPDGGVAISEELMPSGVVLDKNKQGEVVGIDILGVETIEYTS